ncbi:MAG: hypothetical protein FWG50_00615 [Kiritimatiellaeota bacterium]|nr:hypothetical protein [Kiritimatiellota bacterium]
MTHVKLTLEILPGEARRVVYSGQKFATTVEGKAPLMYLTTGNIAHPQ